MRNYFTLNGVNSTTYGVYISGQGTFNAPGRDYNLIPVPGRNGDLIGPEKRLQNGTLTYPAFIYTNFKQNIEDFRNFLLSLVGYVDLVDTYHPGEIRKVCFTWPFDADVESKNDAGKFDITFICKPQRYLASGQSVTTLTANGSITNPTRFDSQPFLRVWGTGQLGIGSQTVTITQADVYTDIDCEMMDCFKGTANKNPYVQFTDHNFPVFVPGVNNISLGTGITKVEITPRWWIV